MANPKRQSPGGNTHCAYQDISTSLAKICESLPGACSLPLSHSGRFWEGTEKPSWSLTLAAHAAPFLPAPSEQLCGGSAHHHPSLGGGDIGHACILSPLPHPKETGESAKSRSVSCNPVVFPVMLHSATASKANTGDVQTGQNLHPCFRQNPRSITPQ